MSDMDDIFGESGKVEEKVEAVPAPVDAVVEAPQVQPEPEPKGEPEGVPPAPAPKDDVSGVVKGILDEREKRQQYQREAEELRRWKAEREAKDAEAQKKPDFYENPDEYMRQREQAQQHAIWNERLNMSELMATNKHGEEAVNAAADAFKVAAAQNPALVHEFTQQRDPYGFVMKWHQKNSMLTEIGEDPAAYKERLRQELLAELQAQQPAPVAAKPTIPGSLSTAPSAAKATAPVIASFDSMFRA